MPSIWPEPFGFAGADAVRAGVKVAAFAVGAIPEWLTEGETGSMAPANPPTARGLAAAILRSVRLAANPRPRLSAPIADDSMEHHVKELLQVLEAARQSPPPTSSLPNAF
jgi:glycosyltransferase involved in cell wall biosynthesis